MYIDELIEALGQDKVLKEDFERYVYGADWSPRTSDEIIPPDRDYAHNLRWGDGNGHSHVRAALLGPSLTVPFVDGELQLGTWQQITYVDFDNRSRSRRLVVQIIGE